jgi:hypothetical protein
VVHFGRLSRHRRGGERARSGTDAAVAGEALRFVRLATYRHGGAQRPEFTPDDCRDLRRSRHRCGGSYESRRPRRHAAALVELRDPARRPASSLREYSSGRPRSRCRRQRGPSPARTGDISEKPMSQGPRLEMVLHGALLT